LISGFLQKEWGMVRGEYERVSSQNRRNGRMPLEFLVEELPDPLPAPSFRMIETRIKGEISFVEGFRLHVLGFGCVNRHIEYGKIQKADAIVVSYHKLKSLLRFDRAFLRSSEKKIDIGCDPCFFQVP